MLNRTAPLTHRDCGNQDVVTIAELCLNRIESYTAGLSGYKYSTVAVDCNSGVWAFLLCAFCRNISCPISAIQPFFASLRSDLEHISSPVRSLSYVGAIGDNGTTSSPPTSRSIDAMVCSTLSQCRRLSMMSSCSSGHKTL